MLSQLCCARRSNEGADRNRSYSALVAVVSGMGNLLWGPRRRRPRTDQGGLACLASLTSAGLALGIAGVAAAAPTYSIVDLGVIHQGDVALQGFRISPNSNIAVGRNYNAPFSQTSSSGQAFSWTQGGGIVGLPIFTTVNPARSYDFANGVNNAGVVVGVGASTASGANPLPLMWQSGVASQIPLPAGQTFGAANDINGSNTVVGSVNGGSSQIAFMSAGGTSTQINTLTPGGAYCVTLFSVNDAGIAVGVGVDTNNAARSVPFIYDTVHNIASEVPSLAGKNGGIAFDVSEGGQIVGTAMQNQGSGTPFYWSQGTGTVEVPLPAGSGQGQANGVNSSGWVVGNSSSAFSVPWLWDGTQTYRLQDLIPAASGWDLSHNTSNSAEAISDSGIIVGTGMIGSDTHAYAMIPVPEPASLAAFAAAGLLAMRRRSRRIASKAGRAVCAAGLVGFGAAAAASAAPVFETVIKSGDAVPGVPGATWNTTSSSFFATPTIDNSGNVALRGQMTANVGGVITNPSNQAGYWYGGPGTLNLFARDGSAGPALANPNSWVHNSTANGAGLGSGSPLLAPNGTMLAGSALNGTGAVNNNNNSAAWTGAYNSMQEIGQQGTTSPSGPTGAFWSTALANLPLLGATVNNAGQTFFGANLSVNASAPSNDIVSGNTTTSNDSGVWAASPSGNTMLARENALTNIGGGTQYGELGTAGGVINGSGHVVFASSLRAGVGGVINTGTSGRNDAVLFTNATAGNVMTAIARKNDPVPGLSGVNYFSGSSLAFFLPSQPINNSGRIVFDAQFGTGWATATPSNEAIMTSLNGNTNVVLRGADPADGVPGATYFSFNTTNLKARLNNNNTMVYTAQLLGTAGGTADDEGIWVTHIDGSGLASSTQLIAREGQSIPNAPGLSLSGGLVAASTPILNNLDQVVFLGTLAGGGVTTSNDQALFEWDQAGGLQMLLREGDSASSITGLSGTIGNNSVGITAFAYSATASGEGGTTGLSDTGWLTLALTLRGGAVTNDVNIIRTQIPEPATVGLMGLCGALALGRRRRTR